ncbi:MAG: DNA primase [Flammeovirgaceae bacterium]|nr:DNA primase [Flammeovirgaceae bacterium]MBR08183.1 DNA primase [Rickettsiales bacterium]|tara:strand:- start:306 stop:2237 length:1932 start_codon:yes stop_codon:yes gene_type:complete
MISPATIEEIKNRMDIVEVVGDFVTLKRSGSSYKALSPFSNEKTPSFYVVPSKGIFKDFSSGKGGDAITFLMEIDGLSYVEALRFLAQRYGVEIIEEEQTDEQQEAQNKRESLFILLNFAKDHFIELLWNHEEGKSIGLSYFKERGFTEETIKDFELGYTIDSWDDLMKTAETKGYNKDLLEEAGLVITKEGGKTYDRFRNRVIFPIHNISGKVVAFGARTLSKDKKQPKYLNSPETELYNKSRILYGLYQAKQEVRKEDNIFLVEGYTDVISMHQTGIKNVVSSSGTALTEDQIKLIRRYTENVTVIFDGDAAGIKASIRGIDMLLEGGLNVRAVALPDGEDPDSYSRQLGTSAFSHYIETESQDIIRFKTKLFLEEAKDDPVKKAGLIKDIVRSITKIEDPVKRTVYLKECSDLLGIQESVLIAEQNKILLQQNKERGSMPEPPPIMPEDVLSMQPDQVEGVDILKVIELQEKESIRVLVNYGTHTIPNQESIDQDLISYFITEVEEIQFTNPVYREILELFKSKLNEGFIIDGDYLLGHGSENIKRVVVDLMTPRHEVSENWDKKFQIHIPKETEKLRDITYSNILRLKFRIVQHLVEEETKKLRESNSDDDIDIILDEINELKKIEMSIAKMLGNVITR